MSKSEIIMKHLGRKSGASMAQLMKVTGWQAHSIRAALSRLRKSGAAIDRSANKKGDAVYRIPVAEAGS